MKKRKDPRHQKRIKAMQEVFAYLFHSPNHQDLQSSLAKKVIKKQKKLDPLITDCAPLWPIDQIAPTDLAILRLAVYELLFEKNIPPKVTIDEAVELAKEFGNDSSFAFVNGVLGAVVKEKKIKTEK